MVTCITSALFDSFSDENRPRLTAESELPATPTEYFKSLKTHLAPEHTVGTAAHKSSSQRFLEERRQIYNKTPEPKKLKDQNNTTVDVGRRNATMCPPFLSPS